MAQVKRISTHSLQHQPIIYVQQHDAHTSFCRASLSKSLETPDPQPHTHGHDVLQEILYRRLQILVLTHSDVVDSVLVPLKRERA
jgi:hypothetical protein